MAGEIREGAALPLSVAAGVPLVDAQLDADELAQAADAGAGDLVDDASPEVATHEP